MGNKNRAWVEINIKNILENYNKFKSHVGKHTKVMGIIKANGYGHGSLEIGKALIKDGCEYLGVAGIDECYELRDGGIDVNILLLNEVDDEEIEKAVKENITFTVFSVKKAKLINEKSKDKKSKVHIKLDTGMNRVGLSYKKCVEEIKEIYKLENIEVEGMYTHFATADEEDNTFTKKQFKRYKEVVKKLEDEGIEVKIKHVCNSAGTIMQKEMHLDLVRVGISLYGYYPSEEVDKEVIKLKPSMVFKSKIVHIKEVEAKEGLSYGLGSVSSSRRKIGTVTVGYADGYSRNLTNQGMVEIKDKLVSVVGKVCMDQILIDLTDVEEVVIGDEVILYGNKVSVENISKKIDTINYETVCMVNRRVPRIYNNGVNVNYLV